MQVGSDSVTSKTQIVNVKRARNWSTSRRDDGAYRDAKRASVRLRVAGGGKRITGFSRRRADALRRPVLADRPSPNISHASPCRR